MSAEATSEDTQVRARILYVDDSRLDRELVRHALVEEHGGFELVEAASKHEFEARLQEGAYDLVVSDFNILGFEGLEVMEQVQQLDPTIPVVIVTGTGSEEVAVEAWKRGAADYVIKTPDHIRRLPLTIDKALRKRRSEEEKQRVERQLQYQASLLQNVSDAIISTDTRLYIESWNLAAEEIYGWQTHEVIGRQVEDVVQTEFSEAAMEGQKDEGGSESGFWRGEVMQRRKDGTRIPILASVSPIRDESGKLLGWVAVNRDITRRKQAEDALRRSEVQYRSMFESVPDAVLLLDQDERVCDVNPAACLMYGCVRGALLGQTVRDILHPDTHHVLDQARRALDRGEAYLAVTAETRADQQSFSAEMRFRPFTYDDRPHILLLVRDITERKRLEKEILEISEREKRRIGRDLHDDLGQVLSGIGFRVASLRHDLEEQHHDEAEQIDEIGQLVEQAIVQTRRMARGLNPINLDVEGFTAVLRDQVIRLRSYGVDGVFTCQYPVQVADQITATHVYRILQETLSNAMRHGRATSIDVHLDQNGAMATLSIQDNGVGFAPEQADGGGMGLRTMQYRAQMINGTLEIRSGPGSGSVVTCSFPAHSA